MPKPKIEWRINTSGIVILDYTRATGAPKGTIVIGSYMDLQHLMTELHDRILPEVEAEIDRREK